MLRPSFVHSEPLDIQVERALIEAIDRGELSEGMRLPPTAELARQWGIHLLHVQRALQRLAKMGYVERKQRIGTVIRRSGRKAKVAILSNYDSKKERLYSTRRLIQLIEERLLKEGYDVHFFDNLHSELSYERENPGVVSNVSNIMRILRPAGLIELGFNAARYQSLHWALGLPRVSVCSEVNGGEVCVDIRSFYQQSFEQLVSMGLQRAVLIIRDHPNPARLEMARERAKACGINIIQTILIDHTGPDKIPEELGHDAMVKAIAAWRKAPRLKSPLAIVVDDDILMRGVASALLREGFKADGDLVAVALCNEGIRHHYGIPVIRIEVPLTEEAERAVDLLTAKILRRRLPKAPVLIPCRKGVV